MLDAANNEKNKEPVNVEDSLHVLEGLETETEHLYEEKMNLLNIEQELLSRINEEIQKRMNRKEELVREIEELKRRCEGLTNVLNSLIKEDAFHQPS
jgi:ABC-type phosphate transport system auxiliary subunit